MKVMRYAVKYPCKHGCLARCFAGINQETVSRYSEGVSPKSFLKAVQNTLAFEKPVRKQMSFTGSCVVFSMYLAVLNRIFLIYS